MSMNFYNPRFYPLGCKEYFDDDYYYFDYTEAEITVATYNGTVLVQTYVYDDYWLDNYVDFTYLAAGNYTVTV